MTKPLAILLLEDEPLILMDLECAVEDRGCKPLSAIDCAEALHLLSTRADIDAAILDVSLGARETCFPVARALDEKGIPYMLHSGDLDRHNEKIRDLNADLIAKPAAAQKVIAAAIALVLGDDLKTTRLAAE